MFTIMTQLSSRKRMSRWPGTTARPTAASRGDSKHHRSGTIWSGMLSVASTRASHGLGVGTRNRNMHTTSYGSEGTVVSRMLVPCGSMAMRILHGKVNMSTTVCRHVQSSSDALRCTVLWRWWFSAVHCLKWPTCKLHFYVFTTVHGDQSAVTFCTILFYDHVSHCPAT